MDQVPEAIAAQIKVLNGPAPDLSLGHQCMGGHGCPFRSRCWPQEADSVNRLHMMWSTKKLDLLEDGVESILDVPDDVRLNVIQTRQQEALRAGRMIVEPGLGAALDALEHPIGFLDFETMQRALPPYDGLWPWAQVTAQFSYHEQAADGTVRHVEWLADEPEDPREPLARAMIDACRDARVILVYHQPFESTRIKELAEALPHLADDLLDIRGRLLDLKRIVMDYVYHPDFEGSFSLKKVLPVLVPDLGYEDLEIQGGGDAMVDIARLLLDPDSFAPGERPRPVERVLNRPPAPLSERTWTRRGGPGSRSVLAASCADDRGLGVGADVFLVVVYREMSRDDGFVITAYMARRLSQRREVVWSR
jgi:hypothetical protein